MQNNKLQAQESRALETYKALLSDYQGVHQQNEKKRKSF